MVSLKLFLAPVVALVVVLFVVENETRPQIPSIPREFQNINFEQYLRNERAMNFQLKCIIYNGPCDTIGKFIKRNIPIYLKTVCKNCEEEQKKLAGKFIVFLQQNYPKEFDDALAKYGKPNYSPEEIADFEKDLGVKIIRDKSEPTRAPGTKPDIEKLVAFVKEGISVAINTKAPLVLGRKDSSTTVVVEIGKGVTIPAQFAKYSTTASSVTSESTTEAPASSSTTAGSTTTPESVTTVASSSTTETI